MAGGNLAEATAAKNPATPNGTINYFNKIGAVSPVWKAGLGCPLQSTTGQQNPTDFR
jgi:hypothetical protein